MYKEKKITRRIIKFIFKLIALFLYRVKVVGKENLPKEGSSLICPNHVHPLDSAVIIATAKRKINVLAKEELFKAGIAKWFAKVFGIYPIKRDSADMGAIKLSLKLLKNEELLMIFPEGTRDGMAKGVKPKKGPVILAIKSGKPIIPVALQGSFKVFRKVKINIGKPIDYSEYKGQTSDKELMDKLTADLMKEIVRLRDEKI